MWPQKQKQNQKFNLFITTGIMFMWVSQQVDTERFNIKFLPKEKSKV